MDTTETGRRNPADHLQRWRFAPGCAPGPGRGKGKTGGEDTLVTLERDAFLSWQRVGRKALDELCRTNPADYFRFLGRVLGWKRLRRMVDGDAGQQRVDSAVDPRASSAQEELASLERDLAERELRELARELRERAPESEGSTGKAG